jgi:fibrillarin-like rRNA methylase
MSKKQNLLRALESRDPAMSVLTDNLRPDQRDMILGIVEIVRQVQDPDNRAGIAARLVKQFRREGIEFDYPLFTAACNVHVRREEISESSLRRIVRRHLIIPRA